MQDEASWEEVRFAHEALSFGVIQHHFVYYAIRKLERYDYLAIRGHRYMNFRNRIALSSTARNEFSAAYCGLQCTPFTSLCAQFPQFHSRLVR